MSYLECRDRSTGRVLGSPSSSPTFSKRQYCYLSVTKTLPKTGSHRLISFSFIIFFSVEHEGVDTMNRQASLGVPPVQSSLSKTREGISKDVPPPPPLRVKKKLRVKGEGVVKNWFAAFSESNVGPRVSEVLAMNSCFLNNEWWLLRPTVRIFSILRLKMTLLSLGLKEKNHGELFHDVWLKFVNFHA